MCGLYCWTDWILQKSLLFLFHQSFPAHQPQQLLVAVNTLLYGCACVYGTDQALGWCSVIQYIITQLRQLRGQMTKINQPDSLICGPARANILPVLDWVMSWKIWHNSVAVVVNVLLTKLAREHSWRMSALGLLCTDQAQQGPYCQELRLIFSQYVPRTLLIL